MRSQIGLQTKVAVWVAAVLPLLGWWSTGLFDLDEGFYAAVVGEMLRRGDWITPYYNGSVWFEKPILLYWLSAPFTFAFGDFVGPRMASVLTTCLLYLAVLGIVKRNLSELAGYWSVGLLSMSLLVVGAGRMMLTDPPYVLFLSLALLCFYQSLKEGLIWRLFSAASLGLAVLAKGPVAGAFFILIVFIFFLQMRDRRREFRGGWLLGSLIFAAIVATWYLPAYLQNGQVFVQKFLIEQNVGRFSGGDRAHTYSGALSFFFYFVILFIACFPWLFKLPLFGQAATNDREQSFLKFCWIWFGVVFVFFTISAAKLPHYVLPCVPPLAILAGANIAAQRDRAQYRSAFFQGFGPNIFGHVVVAALANLGLAAYYYGWQGTVNGRAVSLPGQHAEVHALTIWLKSQPGEVAVFQMPRRQADRGTGTTNLQETSHPSIPFYLHRNVRPVEFPLDLLRPTPVRWVLTRKDRVSPEMRVILQRHGYELKQVEAEQSRNYALFELIPR